jgi:hypothetical protein
MALIKNRSGLERALVTASMAGSTLIQRDDVHAPELSYRRRNRWQTDVRGNPPQRDGVEERIIAAMNRGFEAVGFQALSDGKNEVW